MVKYGLEWHDTHPIEIERHCIRKGGTWMENGRQKGAGLLHHFKELESILWPEEYHNRWTDWMLRLLVEERICVFMACKDAGKTRRVSKWTLMDYWCFPHNTLSIMTSTTNRGLELRVWGDIKSLWERAHDRFDWLEGNPSDSKHGIFTDTLGDDMKIRDMRKGIIGIPTMTSEGAYDGSALAEFAGIKQGRRRLIGDELQFLPVDYLKVFYSMDSGDFKGAFCGNSIAENGKALDRISEPENGWGSEGEVSKTTEWRNKYGGVTLNMVGTDSPNLDPQTRNKFPGMITQEAIDRAAKLPGAKDSVEWWSQIMGVRKVGAISDRVLLVQEIQNNGGFGDVIWASIPSKLLAIDAGYGGDDCVKTYVEYGEEVSGAMVMSFKEQSVYPVAISSEVTPEDQIAQAAKADCEKYDIPYENVFIEAGMRATLAVSFGRILSPAINAINFGGTATDRPVSYDLFVFDEKTQQRRPKTCFEHYSKFVTEIAFAVRDLVMCKQARNFPMPAAEEFQKRKWRFVYGDRYELETKIEYKERNASKSPNCFVAGTMVLTDKGEKPIQHIKIGDRIITPYGSSPVVALHKQEAFVCGLNFSNGRTLKGTPNHKILTDSGWTSMDSIMFTNIIQSDRLLPIWNILKKLFTKAYPSIGLKPTVDIINAQGVKISPSAFFTGLSGRTTMVQFLKICASIIKMAIRSIIPSKTWNYGNAESTQVITSEKISKTLFSGPIIYRDWKMPLTQPRRGMDLRKVCVGTENTPNTRLDCTLVKRDFPADAWNANVGSRVYIQPTCFVRLNAGTVATERKPWWKRSVAFAGLCFKVISTKLQKPVRVNARTKWFGKQEEVYNLTLLEDNVYFANGILVQNCSDSIMIAVEGARRLGFAIEKVSNVAVAPPINVMDSNGNIVDISVAMRREKVRNNIDWLEEQLELLQRFEEENELNYDT